MPYILYKIDDKNRIIYLINEEKIVSDNILLNNKNDYEKILKFANDNNYMIESYEKTNNYEDIFSYKKHL